MALWKPPSCGAADGQLLPCRFRSLPSSGPECWFRLPWIASYAPPPCQASSQRLRLQEENCRYPLQSVIRCRARRICFDYQTRCLLAITANKCTLSANWPQIRSHPDNELSVPGKFLILKV